MKAIEKTPDYFSWIGDLKKRYRATQIKAAVSVNAALLEFYWNLGRDICARYPGKKRNAGFFAALSADLKTAIPESKGLSPTNIKYARYFYELYGVGCYRPQLVDDNSSDRQHADPTTVAPHRPQLVDDKGNRPVFVEQLLVRIPWGHHRIIIDKCGGDVAKALFYVRKTVENGWSRNVLAIEIDGDLYSRHGRAVTNGVVDAGTTPPLDDRDLSYWFDCAYDDKSLCVAVVVADDDRQSDSCPEGAVSCPAWDDDAVEIFLDGEFARLPDSRADGGVHLKHGGEFTLVANGAAMSDFSGYPKTFVPLMDLDRLKAAQASTNVWWTGVVTEIPKGPGETVPNALSYTFVIPWAAMGRTNAPDRIGFNIGVQDDDGGGRRNHALYWTGNPARPFSDESAFGVLVLE